MVVKVMQKLDYKQGWLVHPGSVHGCSNDTLSKLCNFLELSLVLHFVKVQQQIGR